jgi:hypothetical protein
MAHSPRRRPGVWTALLKNLASIKRRPRCFIAGSLPRDDLWIVIPGASG